MPDGGGDTPDKVRMRYLACFAGDGILARLILCHGVVFLTHLNPCNSVSSSRSNDHNGAFSSNGNENLEAEHQALLPSEPAYA